MKNSPAKQTIQRGQRATLYSRSILQIIMRRARRYLFKTITNRNLKLFLLSNDIISVAPLLDGKHEEALTNFIDLRANDGMNDFFIDIGANIGLSSCQNGAKFKKIICFEPNPLCVNILKTNLAIHFDSSKYQIFDYALGDTDSEFNLNVPLENWGGAYVTDGNDYSLEILSGKDGYGAYDNKNYRIQPVTVKNMDQTLKHVFEKLIEKELINGVIKIDVEGFEKKVILSIAKLIPAYVNLTIVFENWDPMLDFNELTAAFQGRNVNMKTFSRSIDSSSGGMLKRIISILIKGDKTYVRQISRFEKITGDIILEIN